MKDMTDTQILEYAENTCKMIVADSPSMRKRYCKFISHSPERHCSASTHEDCSMCKWFSPTIMAKITLLAEENAKMKEGAEKLAKKIIRLEGELEIARETIRYYRKKDGDMDGQGADRKEPESDTVGEKNVDWQTIEKD